MKVWASLLAFLSLATFISGFAAAVSSADQFFSLLEEAEYPPKVPVGPALADLGLILAGTGVASNSTADLPLTLMIESMRAIRPAHAEELFDDLRTIDPSLVLGGEGEGSGLRGHMLLADRPYLLDEIDVSGRVEASKLEAEVVKKTAGGEVVVGHISIETERRDRVWDCEGLLSVEDGIIQGDYHVVLDISPQAERRREAPRTCAELPPDMSRIVSAGSAP
jgi:hypothetical protein